MTDEGQVEGVPAGRAGRGRWALLASVVVVLVGVAVGAAVVLRGVSDPDPAEQPGPFRQAEDGWALPEVVEPSEGAEPLPAGGVVGEGALVYACRDCGTRLVLADGTQRVLSSEMDASTLAYSLSPDGRWLTAPGLGAMEARDLAGSRSYQVAGEGSGFLPWAWSPDSRWLLLAEWDLSAGDADPSGYRLLDLTDGTDIGLGAPEGREFMAVWPSGELWAADVARDSRDTIPVTAVDIAVVDPSSPGVADTFTVDAGQWLQDGETLAEACGSCSSDSTLRGGVQLVPVEAGDGIHLGVFRDTSSPSAVLRVSKDGQVEERVDISLPDPRRLTWIAGRLGDEVLVAQTEALPDRVAFAVALYAVSPDGPREVTRMVPGGVIRVAGAAVHGGSAF